MSTLALRLGPLGALGYTVQRSGLRWLRDDGYACRPGEVIAYCNIALVPSGRARTASDPFVDESRDFQVALAPRVAGILRHAQDSSRGGFLDHLPLFERWSPDDVVAYLEDPGGEALTSHEAGELRLLFLAGHRATELAEVRSGLHSGWHDRSRAWWGDGSAAPGTLLSLGICEQAGIIRGERFAYLELFATVPGPAHIVYMADDALVPCARVVLEQMQRGTAERRAIAEDLARTFPSGNAAPTPGDWMFAGALLAALGRAPIVERYDLLTRAGLRRSVTADLVVLSLNAESRMILRHRRLGYAVNCHRFRLMEAGPATRAWLQANFEPVERGADEILRDYRALVGAARARSPAKFAILNCMSTSGYEDAYHYAAFDRPMGNTLASFRSKELNLMLYDLARDSDVAIIDVDRMAAMRGAAAHLPDGVHASGVLQQDIRAEIVRVACGFGLRGFGTADAQTIS